MRRTDFAQCLEAYLRVYLPGQAGLSENTIMAYRDTFIQMLHFIENTKKKKPDKLTLADFNFQLIVDFLDWLEQEKGNSAATRNQRRIALNTFFKYLQYETRSTSSSARRSAPSQRKSMKSRQSGIFLLTP